MPDPFEGDRLEALLRLEVLDTLSEPLFDSLTELAAQTFDAPIALISLVDRGRQWFKSRVGLDVDETPRDISFCHHTIRSDDVLVVLDTEREERFRHSPLVTGPPHIRFYAGAPLVTPDGFRLGALCVKDTKARTGFTHAQVSRLQAIARSVMEALTLRRDSRALARTAAIAAEHTQLLSLAEKMAGVGTASWDVAANRMTWSDQVYRIHGLEPGVEPPDLQTMLALYHPDDANILAGNVQRALAEGLDYEVEARIRRPDGSERHVLAHGGCRRDANGAIAAIVGTFQDVTEPVKAEHFIRALTNSVPGMVAYWDSDLRCSFANAEYLKWFGRCPEKMIGITMQELLGEQVFAQNEPFIRAAMRGESQSFQRTLVKPSGDIGHTLVRYIPDRDPTGRICGMCVLISDVSDLKRAEEQLRYANVAMREARDEAIAASNVKAEFLANMSHEIRTPLTAILGFTGLLSARGDLPETARMMVDRIKGASSALLSIVNDVLDFSKLEAGHVTIAPKPVDVAELAQDALAMFAPQAEAKSLWLEFEAADGIPDHVNIDPDRLRQILLNLIGNALKFTDEGSVRLQLSYDHARESLGVRVEDSGAGMDETQRARLFQRFSQVDASPTRRHGGAGLGLAICKGLTEAMGGEIGVESRPGHGSAFYFHIQAPAVSAPVWNEDDEGSSDDLRGVRVLVADDNPVNRELARAILEPFEAEVSEAADGANVVAMAAETPFDVILVDLHMPMLDGLEVLQHIRSHPGPNQDAPILALTTDAPDSVNRGSHRFDGAIQKPIVAANMVSALIEATRWHSHPETAEMSHAEAL